MATPFGLWVRTLRKAAGWLQEDLAAMAGIDQSTVSLIERGHSRLPTEATLAGLSSAFGVPLAEVRRRAGYIDIEGGDAGDEVEVRVIGVVPADVVRWTTAGEEGRTVPVPREVLARASYPLVAVEVSGDCLEGRSIRDGDVVVLEQVTDPGAVRNGDVVALRVGDEVTLKVWQLRGQRITLCDGAGNVVRVLEPAEEYELIGVARYRGGLL